MDIKVEIEEASGLLDFGSQNQRELCSKDFVKKVKNETITSDSNCVMDVKTEVEEEAVVSQVSSQNQREFILECPLLEYNKCNEFFEPKLEIKEEECWMKGTTTENLCIYDNIEDETDDNIYASESPRLCMEVVSGNGNVNLLPASAEVSERDTSLHSGKDCPKCENQESKIPTVVEQSDSELSGKCRHGEVNSRILYPKQSNLINKGKIEQTCKICVQSFRHASHIRCLEHFNGSKRPDISKTCDQLPHLKAHNLNNKGKKLHKRKTRDKSVTNLSILEKHNLRQHQCKICDKSFTRVSHLEMHNLIHEGKKPHKCKTCDKSFTQLSHLKTHIMIHDGMKPHQCKTCDKSFTRSSDLKTHSVIHEDKRPYQCKTCNKSFKRLSYLNTHNVIHEDNKPHQCKTCGKRFTRLSSLKRHTLIHQPH